MRAYTRVCVAALLVNRPDDRTNRPNQAPLVVGKCYPNDEGIEYMRGSFADVRYSNTPHTLGQLRGSMFDGSACRDSTDSVACLGLTSAYMHTAGSGASGGSEGGVLFLWFGSPQMVPQDAGDQVSGARAGWVPLLRAKSRLLSSIRARDHAGLYERQP